MTATIEDIDTLEIVDLEEIFDEDVPCVYPECETPAKWRAILTCGHKHNVCSKHKGMLMAKMAQGPWPCAVNGAPVTKIDWVEL
jgi:hypothetical protein